MSEYSQSIGVAIYGLYWAVLCYAYIELVGKHRPAYQRVASRNRSASNTERGQGLVEYALILALVAVIVVGVLVILGPEIKNLF